MKEKEVSLQSAKFRILLRVFQNMLASGFASSRFTVKISTEKIVYTKAWIVPRISSLFFSFSEAANASNKVNS